MSNKQKTPEGKCFLSVYSESMALCYSFWALKQRKILPFALLFQEIHTNEKEVTEKEVTLHLLPGNSHASILPHVQLKANDKLCHP